MAAVTSVKPAGDQHWAVFSRLDIAIGLFCLVLLVLVWAMTLQRIRYERKETTAMSPLATRVLPRRSRSMHGGRSTASIKPYCSSGISTEPRVNIPKLIADGEIDSSSSGSSYVLPSRPVYPVSREGSTLGGISLRLISKRRYETCRPDIERHYLACSQ